MSDAPAVHDLFGFPLREIPLRTAVREALFEDRALEDVTTLATIPASAISSAVLAARKAGVVCGGPLAIEAFTQVSPHVRIETVRVDGSVVLPGEAILRITGPSRAMWQAERVALNYMMHLSGVATLTHQYVQAIAGTNARIYPCIANISWRAIHRLDRANARNKCAVFLAKPRYLTFLKPN